MNDETREYLDTQFRALRADMATKGDVMDVAESIRELADHLDARLDVIEDDLRAVRRDVAGHEARLRFVEARLPKLTGR